MSETSPPPPHLCFPVLFISPLSLLRDQAVVFLESEDARVLVEITRCILACLGHPDTRGNWLEFVGSEANSESFCKLFKFILKSSTNGESVLESRVLLNMLSW